MGGKSWEGLVLKQLRNLQYKFNYPVTSCHPFCLEGESCSAQTRLALPHPGPLHFGEGDVADKNVICFAISIF